MARHAVRGNRLVAAGLPLRGVIVQRREGLGGQPRGDVHDELHLLARRLRGVVDHGHRGDGIRPRCGLIDGVLLLRAASAEDRMSARVAVGKVRHVASGRARRGLAVHRPAEAEIAVVVVDGRGLAVAGPEAEMGLEAGERPEGLPAPRSDEVVIRLRLRRRRVRRQRRQPAPGRRVRIVRGRRRGRDEDGVVGVALALTGILFVGGGGGGAREPVAIEDAGRLAAVPRANPGHAPLRPVARLQDGQGRTRGPLVKGAIAFRRLVPREEIVRLRPRRRGGEGLPVGGDGGIRGAGRQDLNGKGSVLVDVVPERRERGVLDIRPGLNVAVVRRQHAAGGHSADGEAPQEPARAQCGHGFVLP